LPSSVAGNDGGSALLFWLFPSALFAVMTASVFL